MSKTTKFEEVVDVNFFYENFSKVHTPIFLGENKGLRKKKIDKKLYKKIFILYMDVYMKDLYFRKNNMYFFLGGMMKKCRTAETTKIIVRNGIQSFSRKMSSIGLVWYLRPSQLFHVFVDLKKQNGSTNKIFKIENIFKANHSIDLLPKFEEFKKEINKTKKTYI